MSSHHRLMIRFSREHLRFLEDQIYRLDEEIRNQIREAGYEKQGEWLQTVPAVGEPNAATIPAEVGPDPQNFASEKHLSSWAGLCPGNHRSAGKDKGSHTTEGDRWLRGALSESAWGIAARERWPSVTQILADCC
jgi:transposase